MKNYTLNGILEDFSKQNLLTYSEEYSLFLAFLSCFSAKEITDNLDWEEGNQQIFKGFKNKIQYDLKNGIESEVYTQYFSDLLKKINKFSFSKKRKIIAFVSQNLGFFDKNLLEVFIDYCLNSNNKNFRNSAWKNIPSHFFTEEKILNFYQKNKDEKALPVIYKTLDTNSFLEFFKIYFKDIISSEYFFRKICLDLFAKIPDELQEKIKNSEPETYLYLCVKNKKNISKEEVLSLYEKSQNKSFAIWCMGKMKFLDILIEIKNNF
jgi:hypothetical protein